MFRSQEELSEHKKVTHGGTDKINCPSQSATSLEKIENIIIDYVDVTMAIEKIPNGASPGPAGVPVSVLKNSKATIARMLL